MLVKDIYKKDPGEINENDTIHDAVKYLLDKAFNGSLVFNNNGDIVGVISLQDVLSVIVPSEFAENLNLADALYQQESFNKFCQSAKNTKVKEIMEKNFFSVSPDTSVMKVAADLLKHNLYSVPIPVMENGKVVGVITRSEIKNALARGMEIS